MKKILLICFVLFNLTTWARKNEAANQIIGTWKFTSHTKVNEFQKVFSNESSYISEGFTFEPNHTFTHEFIGENGNLVKVLKGKWKFAGDKISIIYSDIDYSLTTTYFYIDKDLVLGQNFSHVILTKENTDFQNVASK